MLLTKIHIPLPGKNIVHRSQLFNKLNTGFESKLILISAPAGYGKTTLLSDWIDQYTIKTAWISLDGEENDPVSFLRYIVSSLQSILPGTGKNVLELLASPNVPDLKSLLSLLVNDLIDSIDDIFIVLDDLHLIDNKEVHKLLVYLLENIPNKLHLIISTRSDPQIPLSRLRSHHQILELRAEELSFDTSDISSLLNNKLKLNLAANDIKSLENKTEGWIAGLQLAAISIQRNSDNSEFIEKFTGSNRFIMDYLLEEVLKTLPKEVEEFILKTSILKQFSSSLCDFVLEREDSQSIIERLEYSNIFIFPLDAERHWYRYHHLFADLLKQKLLNKSKIDINDLHEKAGNWFKNKSFPIHAINHAIEAENYRKAIQILDEIAENMWENGQHTAIMKYGELLPDAEIKKSPNFCLYYAWILVTAGQIKKAEPYLVSAEKLSKELIQKQDNYKLYKKLLGKISVAFAYMYSYVAQSEKILEHSKIAMENLTIDDPFWHSWAWYSYGTATMIHEKFKESLEAFNTALEYGKKTGNIFLISSIAIRIANFKNRLGQYKASYKICSDLLEFINESGYGQLTKTESSYAGLYGNMAIMQYFWFDLDTSLVNIRKSYDLAKNESNVAVKIIALLGYALILQARGDTSGAQEKAKEMEVIIKEQKVSPHLVSAFISMYSYLLIDSNQIEKAYDLFSSNDVRLDGELNYMTEHAYVGYANLLLTEFKIEEAEKLLKKLLNLAQAKNRIERVHELKILFASLYYLKGDYNEASSNLIESMELVASEDIIMYYIVYYDKIRGIIEDTYKIQATKQTKIPRQFIDKLKIAIDKREKLKASFLPSEISSRELDIIKLIAEGFTNQEIAQKLFISLNTVKTHLKNINIKLDTDNRTKAVGKAKKLGLV